MYHAIMHLGPSYFHIGGWLVELRRLLIWLGICLRPITRMCRLLIWLYWLDWLSMLDMWGMDRLSSLMMINGLCAIGWWLSISWMRRLLICGLMVWRLLVRLCSLSGLLGLVRGQIFSAFGAIPALIIHYEGSLCAAILAGSLRSVNWRF